MYTRRLFAQQLESRWVMSAADLVASNDPVVQIADDRAFELAMANDDGRQSADFDGDGDVDSADRTVFATFWTGALGPDKGTRTNEQGDVDGDGDVDTADATLLTQNWTGASNHTADTTLDQTYSISANSPPTMLSPFNRGVNDESNFDSLSIVAIGQPTRGGRVRILDSETDDSRNTNLEYTPPAGLTGVETFTYTASDGTANRVGTITVVLNPTTAITPNEPIRLFDGETLDGFYSFSSEWGIDDDPNPDGFTIEDGMIRAAGDIHQAAMITDQSYRDYVLVLEFKWGDETFGDRLTNAKNSGLFFHSDGLEWSWRGRMKPGVEYEIVEGGFGDIILLAGVDETNTPVPLSFDAHTDQLECTFDNWMCRGGYIWDDQSAGEPLAFDTDEAHLHWNGWDPDWQDILGFRGDTVLESPDGEWNQIVVIAEGDSMEFFLNGVKVNEGFNLGLDEGQIQLQLERAEYFVRRLDLLPLGSHVGPFVVTQNAPQAGLGLQYEERIETRGGAQPQQFEIVRGSLPAGLSLNQNTGEISGMPTSVGEWSFELQVTDGNGIQVVEDIALNVSDWMIALYEFDEGSGTIVHDTSDNGTAIDLRINDVDHVSWHDGTLTVDRPTTISTPTPATKIYRSIVDTNEMTVEAWIQSSDSLSNGLGRIVALSNGPTRANFAFGAQQDSYDVRLRSTENNLIGSSPSTTSPTGTLDTDYSHVVYTRSADGIARIYVDNVLVATQEIEGDLSNWDERYHLLLASEAISNRPWLGTFDTIAIYDRALSHAQITDHYRDRIGGDFDRDRDVDTVDRTTLAQFWTGARMRGEGGRTFEQGDADGDGDVDTVDATLLTQNWTGARLGEASAAKMTKFEVQQQLKTNAEIDAFFHKQASTDEVLTSPLATKLFVP